MMSGCRLHGSCASSDDRNHDSELLWIMWLVILRDQSLSRFCLFLVPRESRFMHIF